MFSLRSGEKLQVLLGGAVNTNELPITVLVEDAPDNHGRTSTKTIDSITTGASAVSVVTGNSAGRKIKAVAIHNADVASATVTVRFYNVNGTTRVIWKGALATLETLHFDENRGWYCTDANGAQKTTASTEASTAQSMATSAATRASVALSAATSLDTGTDAAFSTADSTNLSATVSADTSLNAARSAQESVVLSTAVSADTSLNTALSTVDSANLSKATSQDTAQSTAVSAVQSNDTRQSTDQSTMRSLLASGGQAGF